MRRERDDHTLRPTEVVHELYTKLIEQRRVARSDHGHFLAIASMLMRRFLVDYARRRRCDKRGGDRAQRTMIESLQADGPSRLDILAVHEALEELEQRDPARAKVVELRIFAGMRTPEIALCLGKSRRTVERDWKAAGSWLRRRLEDSELTTDVRGERWGQ